MTGAHGQSGNRHALEDGKRIALHHDAVFERSRLGFIRVADDVVRAPEMALGRSRLPLLACGKGGAAAAQQTRFDHFPHDALGSQIESTLESLVASEPRASCGK